FVDLGRGLDDADDHAHGKHGQQQRSADPEGDLEATAQFGKGEFGAHGGGRCKVGATRRWRPSGTRSCCCGGFCCRCCSGGCCCRCCCFSPPVGANRASQRRWGLQRPACLSEASLRAVPHRREKRRGPVGAAGRFATGPAFFLVTSSLQEQRRSDSPKRRSRWRKLLLLPPQEAAFAVPPLIAVRAFQSKATSKAVSTSASRLPSHFSLLVQRRASQQPNG